MLTFKKPKCLSGVFAQGEPEDLALYTSMLDHPLAMPLKPLVQIIVVNVPLPFIYYQEAQIAIRCSVQGKEGWHVIDLCVDQFLPWYANRWLEGTTRKFLARQVSLDQTKGGHIGKAVEKSGNVFLKATFTAKESFTNLANWEEEFLLNQSGMPNAHDESNPLIGLKRTRKSTRTLILPTGFLMPENPAITTGEVHISSASNHSWTRLISTGTTLKGIYLE